jgi:hypothetical protein
MQDKLFNFFLNLLSQMCAGQGRAGEREEESTAHFLIKWIKFLWLFPNFYDSLTANKSTCESSRGAMASKKNRPQIEIKIGEITQLWHANHFQANE